MLPVSGRFTSTPIVSEFPGLDAWNVQTTDSGETFRHYQIRDPFNLAQPSTDMMDRSGFEL